MSTEDLSLHIEDMHTSDMSRIWKRMEEDQLLPRNKKDSFGPTACAGDTFDSVIARLYLNPCLLDQEQMTRVQKDSELPPPVQDIQDTISRNLEEGTTPCDLESFQGGKLSLCGSFAEGTKVGGPDEFDFQYVMTLDGLEAFPKRLLRTKPRSSNQESRSFFSLRINRDGVFEEITASVIHDRFRNKIAQLLSTIDRDFEVKKAGPAVKIAYEDDNGRTIKIDLTLGLRAARNNHTAHPSQLSEYMDKEGRLKSHFVAAHDYWKICFVDSEQDLLREIIEKDEIKGAVYRIIKVLRDEADIKDPYGDGILPSYPIKVTFLDIAHKDHVAGITWSIQDVAFYVIKILREVERRGLNRSLCSLFIEGDDVMAEADRSYLESRRLLNQLKSKERYYVSLRQKLLLYLYSWFGFMCILMVVKRAEPPDPDYGSYDHGLASIFFGLFCLGVILPWVLKSERIYKLYPAWPIMCLVSLIFQHLPLYAASWVGKYPGGKYDHSPLKNNLWRSYDISSMVLSISLFVIMLCNACRGLYNRKSYFLLDASIFHLIILRPYKWKSPSDKVIPYFPEVGTFNRKIKLVFWISVIFFVASFIYACFLAVALLSVNLQFFSPVIHPIFVDMIGEKNSIRGVCMTLVPGALGGTNALMCLICNVYQRRELKKHAAVLLQTQDHESPKKCHYSYDIVTYGSCINKNDD